MEDVQIGEEQDALSLKLKDKEIIEIIKRFKGNYKKHKDKFKIDERQKENYKYITGEQIDERLLEDHQARFVDNLIYEAEASIKPIALSRIPELLVTPGRDTTESRNIAREVTKVINAQVKSREARRALSVAFKHHPVYFVGCIKARWDPEKGKGGNFTFDYIHPDNLILDGEAIDSDVNKMRYIGHTYNITVKDAFIRFPDKKKEIAKELNIDLENSNKLGNRLATPFEITEMWFTHYEEVDGEWERQEIVTWTHSDIVLKKMKDPNWDWEGERVLFKYDYEVQPEELRNAFVSGSDLSEFETRRVLYNHFEFPQKPYFLMSYDQFGKSPFDVTSRVEQVKWLQDNINKRGRQITEIADRARLKHVFSAESGLNAEDIEKLDLSDSEEHILLKKGEVRKVHSAFPGEQPNAALYQEQEINRGRLFAKMGVNATTRGEVETDTATVAQIVRESDFGRIDDLTEETINNAVHWMANWGLQFIKLRYTEEHFVKILGEEGSVVFQRIDRDMIEDGMEVMISSTGVDKVMAQRRALELAKMQMIDPLTFFEDLGVSQPEERAKRMMTFTTNPQAYMAEYIDKNGSTPEEMGEALNGKLQQDIQILMQGQMPQPPEQVTPEYAEGLNQFLQSPEFQQLPSEIQQVVAGYAQQIVQSAGGGVPAQGA